MMTNDPQKGMEDLLSAVQATDSVLLFSHISPDGDTLGSTLAMGYLVKAMGRKVTLVLDGNPPENLQFLPGIGDFVSPEKVTMPRGAMAISVDVSCEERLGTGLELYRQAAVTAVIDHHGTNPGFGSINLIDGDAPATAILVHRLYQTAGIPIGQEAAVCLYTALSTDTGNFVYRSVNAETFTMMASLMEAGLQLSEYSRILFRQKQEGFVRLLGQALPSLRVMAEGQIAGLCISLEQMKQAGLDPSETDGVVDYAIDLKGVRMAYFAHENADGIKFSLRALSPYRIDEVAAQFSGGGHQLAAGCTVNLPMEQAVQTMEQALADALNEQKKAVG